MGALAGVRVYCLLRSIQSRWFLPCLAFALLLLPVRASAQTPDSTPPNQLTPEERAQGWQLLFDGHDVSHWTGGIGQSFPSKTWEVRDGCIYAMRSGPSLYSIRQYGDFDLRWEWRISPAGNSGVKYICVQGRLDPDFEHDFNHRLNRLYIWIAIFVLIAILTLARVSLFRNRRLFILGILVAACIAVYSAVTGARLFHEHNAALLEPPGFEYQMTDDTSNSDALSHGTHSSAALYDLIAAAGVELKPVGEFNQSRILVQGTHVEHWLNGRKVVEYTLGSSELLQLVARSKYRGIAGFGEKSEGYIMLQNHHTRVWFRDLKILPLSR